MFCRNRNQVLCIDIDKQKIDNLNLGIIPIFEPGIEKLIKNNKNAGRLHFKTKLPKDIPENAIIIIAVGTPPGENGEADLSYVFSVAQEISKRITKYAVIVNKSTVPVGTGKVKQGIY